MALLEGSLEEERREVWESVWEYLERGPDQDGRTACCFLLSHLAGYHEPQGAKSMDSSNTTSNATAAAIAASFSLSNIGQIAISVTDIDRATAFYADTLGMKLLFRVPNMGFFDCDGVRLMLSGSEQQAGTSATVIYFKVSDIHQAFAVIKNRNAAIEREPHLIARMSSHEIWMAFFRDPDGNLLALMSEVSIS